MRDQSVSCDAHFTVMNVMHEAGAVGCVGISGNTLNNECVWGSLLLRSQRFVRVSSVG